MLAADSRATVFGDDYVRVASDYSHKVFDLYGRFGAVTFGWRFLEANTIEGVMEEFVAQTEPPKTIDELIEELKDYFGGRMRKHLDAGIDQPPAEGVDVLGFIVGGYEPQGIGRIKTLYLPTGTVVDVASTAANECGAQWQGESDVFTRLLRGFDPMRISTEGWSGDQLEAVQQAAYLVPFFRMSLQDAIDFATFVIRTTIDTQRFADGTIGRPGGFPTCGGPVEVLVTTSRGVRWVQRTELRP